MEKNKRGLWMNYKYEYQDGTILIHLTEKERELTESILSLSENQLNLFAEFIERIKEYENEE